MAYKWKASLLYASHFFTDTKTDEAELKKTT